jgi:CBS domain-containing protein
MDITVDDILAVKGSQIYHIGPHATVASAVELMNDRNIGALLIIDEGVLLGIFTERDVLSRVVAQKLDPLTTPVYQVATRALVTVRGSTSLLEAQRLVTHKRCRHLPVLENGRVVGLVSIGDLTRATIRTLSHEVEELSLYISGAISS